MTQHNNEIDDYINQFSGITKERLTQLRSVVFQIAPDVQERISYKIPAYFVDKKMLIYFAGYDHHVGVYPGKTGVTNISEQLKPFFSGKSTLKFPNDQELPLDDIKEYIRQRLKEV